MVSCAIKQIKKLTCLRENNMWVKKIYTVYISVCDFLFNLIVRNEVSLFKPSNNYLPTN